MNKLKPTEVVILNITSWKGTSIAAEHYYGKLYRGKKSVEITKPLSRRQAKYLSAKDGSIRTYKVGDQTERFDSVKEVIKTAKLIWSKHFPDAIVLLRGTPASADPMEALVGPATIKNAMNKLYYRAKRIGFWDTTTKMANIAREWDSLFTSELIR